MKKMLVFVVLTTTAFASQLSVDTPLFTLTISAPQIIALGTNVMLEIKIANTSEKTESFVFEHHGGLAEGYEYEVLDEKGQQVPLVGHQPTRLPNGKVLITPSRASGSKIFGEIKPGEYILEGSNLSDRFRFDRPGRFTIRVSRAPTWSSRVYSNPITITIIEKPKDAPALR